MKSLLTLPMTSVQDVAGAIPMDNPLGWQSFENAFRDFQIAKYLNRQNYWADGEIERDRYFLFPTTLQAQNGQCPVQAWSGFELKNPKKFSKIQATEFEDFLITDDPAGGIHVQTATKPRPKRIPQNERYIRIIYKLKLPFLSLSKG